MRFEYLQSHAPHRRHRVHDLLFAVDVGVEDTQNVRKVFDLDQRLEQGAQERHREPFATVRAKRKRDDAYKPDRSLPWLRLRVLHRASALKRDEVAIKADLHRLGLRSRQSLASYCFLPAEFVTGQNSRARGLMA